MLVDLGSPYADTTAKDLSFALGLPAQPALHTLRLSGLGLQLRLLGASHQVILRRPSLEELRPGLEELVETVACLPGRRPDLPPSVTDADRGYRFTARVRHLAAGDMSAAVDRLRQDLAGDPYALVGRFPGSPDAVTAMLAYGEGSAEGPCTSIGWRTWHAYPQTGELVETMTVVELPPAPRATPPLTTAMLEIVR